MYRLAWVAPALAKVSDGGGVSVTTMKMTSGVAEGSGVSVEVGGSGVGNGVWGRRRIRDYDDDDLRVAEGPGVEVPERAAPACPTAARSASGCW